MPILILLAFNWFVLFVVLYIGDSFWHHRMTPALAYQMAGIAFALIVATAFLFNSVAGQWFLRLLSGARVAIGREHAMLDPLISQVQERIAEQLGLPPMAVTLMVTDDPLPNGFAIGKGTLVLSRTLYETANDDELAAVIAHECGHLHNGDSQRLGIALGVSLISLTIAGIAGAVLVFVGELTKHSAKAKEAGSVMLLFSLFFGMLAGTFWLLAKIGNGVLHLMILFVGRKQEFKADQFTVNAGYGEGLLSFLDKIKNLEFGKATHLFARLYATHPAIMLRIGRLEQLMPPEELNN
jgi:Zn-dependent protease with chaperone function